MKKPFFYSIIGSLANILGAILLTRFSDPTSYGNVISVIVIFELLALITDLGLGTIIIQSNEKSFNKTFSTCFCISIFISIIYGVICTIYIVYTLEISLIIFVFIFSKIISINSVLYQSIGRWNNKYEWETKFEFFSTLASYLLAVLYIFYFKDVYNGIFIRFITKNIFMIIYIYKYKINFKCALYNLDEIFKKIKSLFVSNLSYKSRDNFEKIILYKYYGPEIMAIFDRGKTFTEFGPNVILSYIRNQMITSGSRLCEKQYKILYYKLVLFSTLMIVFAMSILNINNVKLIDFVLGKQWNSISVYFSLLASLSVLFGYTVLLRTYILSKKLLILSRNISLIYVLSYLIIMFLLALLNVKIEYILIGIIIQHLVLIFSIAIYIKIKLNYNLLYLSLATSIVALSFNESTLFIQLLCYFLFFSLSYINYLKVLNENKS